MRGGEITGIDFGKKYAGTTVIARVDSEKRFSFDASQEKRDADLFIHTVLSNTSANEVFIDAPLSLPGIYRFGSPYNDYFYRKADQEVGGMSPLFLGAMTARAIRLKDRLQSEGVECIEVYPAELAKRLGLKAMGYKGKRANLKPVAESLKSNFQADFSTESISSWHHIDALLAALSGYRYQQNNHQLYGDENEGQIVV